MENLYAVVDIETTGGKPSEHRIIEISIFIFDGNEIIDEFTSLINPERDIPYFITKLTGITNKMVENAPKFYEIAKKIVQITENKIFVAHNSGFDYSFLKHEFKRLGFDYERKQMCTVKLSRKYIPGLPSYSLGNLCKSLNISINGRHRAAGDALATVKVLELIRSKMSDTLEFTEDHKAQTIDFEKLNKNLTRELLDDLPEETGVYYFYDDRKDLIYIGKSKNIRKRVLSHLNNNSNRRYAEMKDKIADIGYEITGSELVALLKESEEIKIQKPHYNRHQRRSISVYGLYLFKDKKGYLNLKLAKNTSKEIPITSFYTLMDARKYLFQITEKYDLCQKLCGLYHSENACFQFGVGKCKGACIGIEIPDTYNKRVTQAIEDISYKQNNFVVIDTGRDFNEISFVIVENGKYLGYGFVEHNITLHSIEEIKDYVIKAADNRDIKCIIKHYLSKNKVKKIVYY